MDIATDLRLPFEVRALTPKLGAEILGVELANGISAEIFLGIYRAFLRYQVLLFGPQELPPGDQVAFARQFGEASFALTPKPGANACTSATTPNPSSECPTTKAAR